MLMSHENTFAERDLTERERLTAHWLLENGNADAAQYAEQLSDATVVGVCGCGCASIDFAVDGKTPVSPGVHLLSDYYGSMMMITQVEFSYSPNLDNSRGLRSTLWTANAMFRNCLT